MLTSLLVLSLYGADPSPAAGADRRGPPDRVFTFSTPGYEPLPPSHRPRKVFALAGSPERRDSPAARITPDAVLAIEEIPVAAVAMVTTAPVEIGDPFETAFLPGARSELRRIDGAGVPCLSPAADLQDREGLRYWAVCFLDRDGDGDRERARLLRRDGDGSIDFEIDPVRFAPAPGEVEKIVQRRIRVEAVRRGRALLIVEERIASARDPNPRWPWGNVGARAELRLREGAAVELGGVTVRAVPDGPGEWRAAVEGDFPPWLELREGGTLIWTESASASVS